MSASKRSYWTTNRIAILSIVVAGLVAIIVAFINGCFSPGSKPSSSINDQKIMSPHVDSGSQNNTQIQQTNNNTGNVNNEFISGNKETVNNDNRKTEIKISDTSKKIEIHGKNINTGTNNGTIGDTYTGIEQRHVTQSELDEIISYIPSKTTRIQFSIMNNAGDEGEIYANEIAQKLYKLGYSKIMAELITGMGDLFRYRNWGITYQAPDSSYLFINIMPASNINK